VNHLKVYIIAEAGANHNGQFDLAVGLFDAAAAAGADCVKFQTFKTEEVVSKHAQKAPYQKETTGNDGTEFEMVKKLELPFEDFIKLRAHCAEKRIQFLSTPFDLPSIAFLSALNLPFWKIPSGEITNLPYLLAIAKSERPVIMSTGMCEIDEIQTAVDTLKENGTPKITLLHCNTEYPTPFEDVNLTAMLTLKERFGVEVGYSDHTTGIEVPIAAVALGASVIEKHFTLDKHMEGPDHRASLEPAELSSMVNSIRNIEKAMGNGIKEPSRSERKNIVVARKSIVARCAIKKGDVFSNDNITAKRPGNGISPMLWFDVLGKAANRDFKEDELIEV
jgi:N,N'-diacetyllegionaminate synthase